jgi:hypothetical protein
MTMTMTATARSLALLGIAALTALTEAGCHGGEAEYDGIGPWRFPHTTRKDITEGLCQPTDLNDGRKATWCFAQSPIKIGARTAEVDLYFAGTDPAARLIEIQLKVRGCREEDLKQWLRTSFGAPIETRPQRAYWKNSFLWAAALLPSEPGRCLVHVLPLSENAEIDRIKQE